MLIFFSSTFREAHMTLEDLLRKVKDLDPKTEVVFAHDNLGSYFSEVEGLTLGVYNGEDFCMEDRSGRGKRAICLWPPE